MKRDEADRVIAAAAVLGEPIRYCALCWHWSTARGWRHDGACMSCEGTGLRPASTPPPAAPAGGER